MNNIGKIILVIAFLVLSASTARLYVIHLEPLYLLRAIFEFLIAITLWRARKFVSRDTSLSTFVIVAAHVVLPLFLNAKTDMPLGLAPLALVILGVLLSAFAVLDIGKSFGVLPARRSVVTNGAYSFVRHPIYLGYVIAMFGWCLFSPTPRNILLFLVYVFLTLLRIRKEEEHLLLDAHYTDYSKRVANRLIPGVY